MEKPKDEGGGAGHHRAEEDARNNGTTFVLKKRGEEEISWSWKRKALQGHSHEIALAYRKKVLTDIQTVLTDVGGDKLLQQFVDGCFGHLLRFIGGTSCSRALHELISREINLAGARDDELWFHIGKTNIRFAPAEYALVTGLRFGSSTFDPLGAHEMPPEGVFNRFCSGQPVTVKELWNMFNQRHLIRPPEDYLKVAHVLALSLMALGYDQIKTVERWVWVLVDDLDAWNRFPWGAYTYQALMYYVSLLPTKRAQKSYHFYGPVWALQIWAYEAIPCLGDQYALATRNVSMPRCLNWSFPGSYKKFPKQFLDGKVDCYVTLEPTNEEKLQPYWLSVQTEQPLGVRYAPRQSRKQRPRGRKHRPGVALAGSLSPPRSRPRRLRKRTSIVESYLGEPNNPVEVVDIDDNVSSAPEPSARPSCTRAPELLFPHLEQLSNTLADRLIEPVAEKLFTRLEQKMEDFFRAREVGNKIENPGCNANCAKADEKKEEQSVDGGSSSMHNSRLDEPAAEDAFGSEKQCEVPMNDPRLDPGVCGRGESFANQEDPAVPNEESRSKRDGPIRPQSDSTEKGGIGPPRAGKADEPELLADPSSSKMKKKEKRKSSSTSKRRRRSPSSDEETTDDEGSRSSSGDERRADPSPSKKKNKKKKSSSTSKRKRRSPSSDEETSSGDEGSDSSSHDKRSRKMKKRGKRKKGKRSESSSSESDRHRRRKKRHKRRRESSSESDARGSLRRQRHRCPHRHRSVSSSSD